MDLSLIRRTDSRSSRRAHLALVLGVLALSDVAAADTELSFLVSTTSNVASPGADLPDLDDADLLHVRAESAVEPWIHTGSWLALLGVAPGDVDALAFRPGAVPGSAAGLAFSTLGDFEGFLDGDVLGLAADGSLELLVPEESLSAGLGTPGAALDVDAAAFDDQGRLLFSLQSDLDGTVLGSVLNGDVLRLEADGSVTRVAGEAEVEAALVAATSSGASIGDVHGVDWFGGELFVAVQSPGSVDGGVLAVGAQARMVVDEDTLGLGGAELDALCTLAPDAGAPGALWVVDEITGRVAHVRGGTPGGIALALATPVSGFDGGLSLGGFGALGVDPLDPALAAQLSAGPTLLVFDGAGAHASGLNVPTTGAGIGADGALGWTFQVLDLTSLAVSPPLRVLL